VIDYLSESFENVVYYYFNYYHPVSGILEHLMRCLLQQLLGPLNHIPPIVEDFCQHAQCGQPGPRTHEYIEMFIHVVTSIRSTGSPVFVVLDGLDECSGSDVPRVAQTIEILAENAIKVFVTSRPHISSLIKSLPSVSILAIDARADDIRHYSLHYGEAKGIKTTFHSSTNT